MMGTTMVCQLGCMTMIPTTKMAMGTNIDGERDLASDMRGPGQRRALAPRNQGVFEVGSIAWEERGPEKEKEREEKKSDAVQVRAASLLPQSRACDGSVALT
eukprot:3555867-Rhodomonas_salina.3